ATTTLLNKLDTEGRETVPIVGSHLVTLALGDTAACLRDIGLVVREAETPLQQYIIARGAADEAERLLKTGEYTPAEREQGLQNVEKVRNWADKNLMTPEIEQGEIERDRKRQVITTGSELLADLGPIPTIKSKRLDWLNRAIDRVLPTAFIGWDTPAFEAATEDAVHFLYADVTELLLGGGISVDLIKQYETTILGILTQKLKAEQKVQALEETRRRRFSLGGGAALPGVE
ncbi:unnamed protein product, partial [marine sediment metagenome]